MMRVARRNPRILVRESNEQPASLTNAKHLLDQE